jgi:hypothetical protein
VAEWTPEMVEERLVEAAAVLRLMPPVKVQGYFNLWPQVVHDFGDLVEQEPPKLRMPYPSPDAITRMEETLGWTAGLDPIDARIVHLRASGKRWKDICWMVGLARAAAHEHWLYALCVIAWKLKGRRVPNRCARRYVITMVREVPFALEL